jgi:hypothetical protein
MKNKIISAVILFIGFLIITQLFESCKNNPVVQPQQQNNPNPTVLALVSPQNETTTRQLQPILVWQSYPSAVSYQVQMSLDANISGTIIFDSSGITNTQMQVAPNKLNTAVYYYWRVRARLSSTSFSDWSVVWRFNIVLNAPNAPALTSPPNGAINVSFLPLLQWSHVDSADFYRIQLSRTANFSSILFDSNRIVLTQLQMPIFYINTGTQYYWRANASNSNGVSTSPWSTAFNFTTVTGPQPNSLNGTITFVDSNFTGPPYAYMVGAFTNWPPAGFAVPFDSLAIHKVGNVYIANYTIPYLINGNYYLAVLGAGSQSAATIVLGIYGCDTVHLQYSGCPNNPTTAQIQNNEGTVNINFLSWADTSKHIF